MAIVLQAEDSSSSIDSNATVGKEEHATNSDSSSITEAGEKEVAKTLPDKAGSEDSEVGGSSTQQEEVQDIIPDRVFVGNLPYSVTEDQVRELTPDLKIISVEIPKKTFFNRFMSQPVIQSKGYGFITYTSAEDATRAIEEITGKKISEREIYAKAAIPQSRNRNRHNNYNYANGGNRGNFYSFNGYGGGYGSFYRYGYMPGGAPEIGDLRISSPGGPEGMYNNVYYPQAAGSYYYPGVAPQPTPQLMGRFYGPPVMAFGAGYRGEYAEKEAEKHSGKDEDLHRENSLNADEDAPNESDEGAKSDENEQDDAENGTEHAKKEGEPREDVGMLNLDMKMMQVGTGPLGMEARYNQPYRRQRKTKEEKIRKLQEGTPSKTTIFVGNLDRNVTVNDLREFFKDLEPQWIRVPRKTLPKYLYERFKLQNIPIQNKGIAFVRFANEEKQKNAIEKLNGVEFRGKPLNVTVAIDSASDKMHGEREKKQEDGDGVPKTDKDEQETKKEED